MTNTTKIMLTALLLTLATLACAQRPGQAAEPPSPAIAPGSPFSPAVAPTPGVAGGIGSGSPSVMGGPPMAGMSPMDGPGMGGAMQTRPRGGPGPLVKMTLDFAFTWDPALNNMTTNVLTQILEDTLAEHMGSDHPWSVKVRQVQGAAAPAGSAPATLRAEIHVECTLLKRDCSQMEDLLRIALNGAKPGEQYSEHMTDMAKERTASLQDQLGESRGAIMELTGTDPRTGLESHAAALPRVIESLTEERIATDARVMALEEQIMRMQKEADQKIKTDPMVQELTKIVELQEKALELFEKAQAQGAATAGEIPPYRIKLAEARIALAQRKEAISTGSGQLAKFSSMLAELSVERTVMDKKIEAATRKLEARRNEVLSLRSVIAQLEKDTEQAKGYSIGKVERKVEPLPPGSQPAVAPSGAGPGMGQ